MSTNRRRPERNRWQHIDTDTDHDPWYSRNKIEDILRRYVRRTAEAMKVMTASDKRNLISRQLNTETLTTLLDIKNKPTISVVLKCMENACNIYVYGSEDVLLWKQSVWMVRWLHNNTRNVAKICTLYLLFGVGFDTFILTSIEVFYILLDLRMDN